MNKKIDKIVKSMMMGSFFELVGFNLDKLLKRLSVAVSDAAWAFYPINKNKIVFCNIMLKYGDNPKYIVEELLAQKLEKKMDIVFFVSNLLPSTLEQLPQGVRAVAYNTWEACYELATAKVIVENSYVTIMPKKKRQQVIIETWHGSLGIKRIDAKKSKSVQKTLWLSRRVAKKTNYLISNSQFEEDFCYRGNLWPTTIPMLRYGHARNDLFFGQHNHLKQKVYDYYQLDKEAKVALYAPTFREYENEHLFDLDFNQLAKALQQKFGGKWTILVRYHYLDPKNSAEIEEGCLNASDYPDMQELIVASQIAITDYSSWIYDFILTGRPGFIYATDIDQYINDSRGFYYPITTTPFSLACNNQQLVDNIINFNTEQYQLKLKAFLDDKQCMDDGQACQRIVALIKKEMDM